MQKLSSSGFDANKRTIILIPGFFTNDDVDWQDRARNLWLELDDVNVIEVTWSSANRYVYSRAVANTPLVARQTTIFLYYLAELSGHKLTDEDFVGRIYIVGHSLGAHIAGFLGQDLGGKVGRITGLDPAGPSFDKMSKDYRLDISDALLVDVLHTNGGQMHYINAFGNGAVQAFEWFLSKAPILNGVSKAIRSEYSGDHDSSWLGINAQVGHIDYYANNGRTQPGCEGLLHFCDHGRAEKIYGDVLEFELQIRSKAQRRDEDRLLAFSAPDYETFHSGRSIETLCPSLGNGTLRRCSIPIDFLKPANELRRELNRDYGINFDKKLNQRQRYYFKTLPSRPLVGEHDLLKIGLDRSSSWNSDCALDVNLTFSKEAVANVKLNKNINFVDDGRFYGIVTPFINPNGYDSREALNRIMRKRRNNSLTESDVDGLVSFVMPTRVDFTVLGSQSTTLLEQIKNRVNFSSKSCYLGIKDVEIQPIAGFGRNVIGTYANTDSRSLSISTRRIYLALVDFISLRSKISLVRRLDTLVLP